MNSIQKVEFSNVTNEGEPRSLIDYLQSDISDIKLSDMIKLRFLMIAIFVMISLAALLANVSFFMKNVNSDGKRGLVYTIIIENKINFKLIL